MWLAKQVLPVNVAAAAEVGVVTPGGVCQHIYTDREYRNTTLYAPGGYFWRPTVGQDMLVIKETEDHVCITGAAVRPPEDLLAGEVCIR